jgi:hypothetical protein
MPRNNGGRSMPTKTNVVNAYDVQFVFDYTTINTCVFAMHEDACEAMAMDQIEADTGISFGILSKAFECNVTLIDEDVL